MLSVFVLGYEFQTPVLRAGRVASNLGVINRIHVGFSSSHYRVPSTNNYSKLQLIAVGTSLNSRSLELTHLIYLV